LSGDEASPVPDPQPTRMKLNFGPLSGEPVDASRKNTPWVVRRMDRHAEAVRHAALGEQLLRAVRVVGHGLQLVAHAEEALRQELSGLDRLALHHAADDRVAVDRHRDRAAHAHVAQRALDRLAVLALHERRVVAEMVQVQIDDAVGDGLRDRQLRVLLEPRHVGGRHLVDHVDVAGEQSGYARRIGLDAAEHHALPARLLAPILVVALHDDAVAGRVFHEFVRTGADGRLARVVVRRLRALAVLARDDEHLRHIVRHQRIGRRGLDVQRVVVDLHERLAARVDAEARRAALDVGGALEAEDHVVGGERRAVVEAHVFAQLEFPGRRVDRLPGLGEVRGQALALVLPHQAVEDVAEQRVVRRQVVIMRVHRRRLGSEADPQLLRRCTADEEGKRCDNDAPDEVHGYVLPADIMR
jgi:hypothetical protein